MRLSELLSAAGVQCLALAGDTDVSSVVSDSRKAGKGSCFVAFQGPSSDGRQYIAQALLAGAAAVVCQGPVNLPQGTSHALVPDSRRAAATLAQAIRGWPSRKLTCVGVTGTKGKSTITYMVRSVLSTGGHSAGLIGTIGYDTGARVHAAANTTPGPIELAELCDEMVAAGKTHLVMEVSSHALDQDRTAGIEFAVGIFSNLTGDHIDYHKTTANYLAAKRRLFESLAPLAWAVVNRDDPSAGAMLEGCRANVIRYGLGPARPATSRRGEDLSAAILHADAHGTRFELRYRDELAEVRTTLIGAHNVHNALAAAGAGLALGARLTDVAGGLAALNAVPGRLERVQVPAPYQVFVDYAHTDDSLDKALTAVRPLTAGRVTVVFGCGGNRDKTKRPRMAAVAQRLADSIIVTSDNPRHEQPGAIIDDIVAGFSSEGKAKLAVEPDRRKAIELAVGRAREGDLVLLAGKGHEDYQDIAGAKLHFDDREVAAQAMRQREGTA
jgi:UDP-N-acetylmuramoyl-L-alanyl-D-glutamate--2,6-diaminopimelate ligase